LCHRGGWCPDSMEWITRHKGRERGTQDWGEKDREAAKSGDESPTPISDGKPEQTGEDAFQHAGRVPPRPQVDNRP
jgi:hypothetical protein